MAANTRPTPSRLSTPSRRRAPPQADDRDAVGERAVVRDDYRGAARAAHRAALDRRVAGESNGCRAEHPANPRKDPAVVVRRDCFEAIVEERVQTGLR
jgi:hypothetical protein